MHTVDSKSHPLIKIMGPFKRIDKDDKRFVIGSLYRFGVLKHGCLPSSRGPGGFRELVAFSSTDPGTSRTPWCEVVAESPGEMFVPSTTGVASMFIWL